MPPKVEPHIEAPHVDASSMHFDVDVGKTVTRGFLNGWNEVFGDGAAECETYDEEEEKAQH